MNNSTKTLQTIKDALIRETKDESITDQDIIDGANDFYAIVHQTERQVDPAKYRSTTGTLAVTSSGYDLTNLTNPSNYSDGFRVYKDSVASNNLLRRSHPATAKQGYYISGDTLYLKNLSDPQDIIIEFRTKGTRVTDGSTLTDHTLQINQDLETAMRKFIGSWYFNGKYQFDLRDQAEDKAFEEIRRYFNGDVTPSNF